MGVQIGAKPDSGFDDPIGMLKDCHRRIEQFLRILCVVIERAAGRRLTEEESAAVQSALRYFCSGGRRHTADEEESLFPRLRSGGQTDSMSDLARLEDDHQFAAECHELVESLYTKWIVDGALLPEYQKALADATGQLAQLYAAHIDVEETVVFPLAAKTLSPETIATIGQEFKSRRG